MAIKSLAQTLKDLATGIKNAITGITGSNATLTITKGNGTTSTVTVNNVANATNAIKATQDSAGQQINTTYIKGLSASNATLTYTKGNGTTGTVTVNNVATATNADKLDGYHYTDIINNAKASVSLGAMGAPNWGGVITASGHNTTSGFTAPANGFCFLNNGAQCYYINGKLYSVLFSMVPVKKGDNFRSYANDADLNACFVPCS